MADYPHFAAFIFKMTDEQRLTLIPAVVEPPSLPVFIPVGVQSVGDRTVTSYHPFAIKVEPGDTRKDVADRLVMVFGDWLEGTGYFNDADDG